MDAILTSVTSFVTESIEWINLFAGAVVAQPLLLMFVITSFVGLGVGLIKRLVRI